MPCEAVDPEGRRVRRLPFQSQMWREIRERPMWLAIAMKKKLPELTPAHLAFRANTATLEDHTARYVTPLYGVDEDDERYAYGSAVLLQIAKKYFLVTAAHVLDENQREHATIQVFGRNTFHSLSGPSLRSPLPASGSRDDDVYDTGILELPDDMAHEVQAHRSFLDIARVDPSEKPYLNASLYTVTGYPSRRQRLPRKGKLTFEAVRYTGVPLHPTKFPLPYELGPHHGIDYDHKQMIARNAKIEIPIAPYGSSGGGLFRLGAFADIKSGTATPTLIGIATTVKPGCLLATNIAYALALITAAHPDLGDSVPTSSYCTFSVELSGGLGVVGGPVA